MAGEYKKITLPVAPWFVDHHFAGRIVLAAVEAMQCLATTVQAAHPQLKVTQIRDARFGKLLEIPWLATEIDALVELEQGENGEISARLLTRAQGKVMARLITHCELTFAAGTIADAGMEKWRAEPPPEAARAIKAAQVYQELVPFGPAYQTLRDQLVLQADMVWGSLLAPKPGCSPTAPLGSPFPLDGAMHAACVHGQQLVDFVPFPVGFASRHIVKHTCAGEWYRTQALLQVRAADELCYDLWIVDRRGQVREMVRGLRMRDVSHGRIKPPGWIKTIATGRQPMVEA